MHNTGSKWFKGLDCEQFLQQQRKLYEQDIGFFSDWPFFRPQVASDFANFDGLKRDFKTCQACPVLKKEFFRRWVPKCAQQKRILRCF